MKNIKLNIFVLIFIFFFSSITVSSAKISSNFINEISIEASSILSSNEPREHKIDKLIKIAEEAVDINGIGSYTLGKHRKVLTDGQKKQYQKIFRNYFLKSFSNKLVEYEEAKIVVVDEDVKNEKYTIVKSKLVATSSRPEISIDWRVYTKDPDRPLIRDLIIEGLSLARTQKEEFNSIILNNDGNINALFDVLEDFVKN